MSSNIIHAFGAKPLGERQKDMLRMLDEVRAMVERGGISCLGIAIVENGSTETTYSGASRMELLGAATRLAHHINKDIDGDF